MIAVRGGDDYLLVDSRSEAPEKARVLADGVLYPSFNIHSILARGYWEEGSLPDDELDALISEAEVRPTDEEMSLNNRLYALWGMFAQAQSGEEKVEVFFQAQEVRRELSSDANVHNYIGNMLTHLLALDVDIEDVRESLTDDTNRYQPTTFAKSLRAHVEAWCHGAGSRPRAWAKWTDGIYPDYRTLAEKSVRADSVRLHEYATHILSSQAFAFNLFLPFRKGAKGRLSERISEIVGARVTIDRVHFEWVPPGGLLGELDGDRPMGDEPATGVDVALWGRLKNHRRAVVLIEVKLSEGNFTHCGGRNSRRNGRRDVCESAKLFLDEPNACYLRRPWGKQRDRRYWEIFARSHGSVWNAFPNTNLDGPCPFAYDMQQPMRNLAIARGLEQEDMVERAWFALCAHDANRDIAMHWENWKRLLGDPSMAPSLRASEVVAIGEADGLKDWAAYMRARYRL